MDSSCLCISILLKSNIPDNSLINFLNEVTSQSLRNYLRLANVYDGNANKKKSDLIETIIYGCMNGYLEDKIIDDISLTKAYTILKEKNIIIKSLPGYGNLGLKKRDIKQYVKHGECSIKLQD